MAILSCRTLRHFLPAAAAALILLLPRAAAPAAADNGLLAHLMDARREIVTISARNLVRDGARMGIAEKTGAGVVLDPGGIIVTNTHILYGSTAVTVILADGTRLPAGIIHLSREHDMAFLKVAPPAPLPAASWATSPAAPGDRVATIGHSPLLAGTISGGTITGLGTRTESDGRVLPVLLRIDIDHYAGDSGGPVFNARGEFLGLITARGTGTPRTLLAVPAAAIRAEKESLVLEETSR